MFFMLFFLQKIDYVAGLMLLQKLTKSCQKHKQRTTVTLQCRHTTSLYGQELLPLLKPMPVMLKVMIVASFHCLHKCNT